MGFIRVVFGLGLIVFVVYEVISLIKAIKTRVKKKKELKEVKPNLDEENLADRVDVTSED